ncbi:Universal stress protein E [Rosistilla carotiformis]|uniref:Universal stress protein E n=1 Tax=Rosistilla carotiformis TaxID=2528017 RepID=A0A518JTC4_9BACT|nr:universal stress protein [Rosistilla carotiformis]QDV68790.1 Universal stress protein E [Rosistilla carotiformis]
MKRFQNILVALDTRSSSHPALDWALSVAVPSQSRLTLVDVLPELSWVARNVVPNSEAHQQLMIDDKKQKLEELAAPIRARGQEVTTRVLRGKTSRALCDEVFHADHDLLVRVTRGIDSRSSAFYGTTGSRLLRSSPCAVALIHPNYAASSGRILAAIDPARNNPAHQKMTREVLDLTKSLADLQNKEMHVVHAWVLFTPTLLKSTFSHNDLATFRKSSEADVAKEVDEVLEPYGLSHRDPRVHLVEGRVEAGDSVAKCADAENVEMIVMGTMARSGLAGALIGNTAERVLELTNCSLLTIKPDAFISPATGAHTATPSSAG